MVQKQSLDADYVAREMNVRSHSLLKVDLHKQMFTSLEMKTVCHRL